MNSLNRYRPAKQFRCMPLMGDSPFRYVEIVRAPDGSHNYHSRNDLVGAFSDMNEKGREEWNSLTGGTKTDEASQSTSLVTTGKSSRSSSAGKAMSMSVCSLLSNSKRSLKGRSKEVLNG